MASLYTREPGPDPQEPVLLICLDGWIDAGLGAATALASLTASRPASTLATWDADAVIDHRARRPVLRIVDGVAQSITWPEISLTLVADDAGHDIVVLAGPEPDMRWHAFAASVVELARELGVRLAVGIGAFPAPVPHTRPMQLVATAADRAMAERVGFVPGAIDVPAGIQAVLEQQLNAAGIPSVGLWARVPHYVVSMPYPAASAALLDGVSRTAGVEIDTRELHDSAARSLSRIDELIANSDEHRAMVAQLEAQVDRELADSGSALAAGPLPSGDELAAELERFLRGDSGA